MAMHNSIITVGETYDLEFSRAPQQDLVLDLIMPRQKIHTAKLWLSPEARSKRKWKIDCRLRAVAVRVTKDRSFLDSSPPGIR